jgi:hypothetical protein
MKVRNILIGAVFIFAIGLVVLILKRIPSRNVSGFTDTKVISNVDTMIFDQVSNPPPYSIDPINSVDDYEYNLVFKGEGDKTMTKATRDILMSAYPKDWSTHPPSSELFQQGLAEFKEGFQNAPSPQKGNPYKEVDGNNMTPPDSRAAEEAERDILATYVPKKPGELTTYDLDDAEEIVKRIYNAKGLVPDVKRMDNNVITIMGTRKVGEALIYEDEYIDASGAAPTGSDAIKEVGEGTINVPVNMETLGPKDPFFTPSSKSRERDEKWDYASWTPGLERMFAPTESQEKWY